MIIRNAFVFGADRKFEKRDIVIKDGFFAGTSDENGSDGQHIIDGSGCYAVPGFIDIHFHGAAGQDVSDGDMDAYRVIAEYEASSGVTAICPALLTLPEDDLIRSLETGAVFAKTRHPGADLIGFNMEGPFISHVKNGAQNEKYILHADAELTDKFLRASDGLLKIIGLAPEENPGFEDYIRKVKDKVIVSLAHTNADYDAAMCAFRAGASHVVHLYNAMTGLSHRAPGVVGAAADSQGVYAEIICDGIHVHPAAVRAAFKLLGPERMILISDSLRCTGMRDGEYTLGGRPVIKKGRICTLKDTGALAGSASNLMDCVRQAVNEMHIPLEEVIAAATINPARAVHEDRYYGSIETGKHGNLLLLSADEKLDIRMVIKDGKIIREQMLE